MTYVRAEKAQIDAWGAIGSQGWSWDELFPYYKKSENFTIPNAKVLTAGGSYIPRYHGDSGPLRVGYYNDLLDGDFPGIVKTTWQNIGIPHNQDVNGGHVRGFTVWPSTLDRHANVREDAARAYYYPIQSRPNLYIFLNTTVSKILWKDPMGEVEADGVEMISSLGEVISLQANREVILSAGSLRSPAILELSGIGNPS
jgi:choline dehydrogenase-like flavoprotein